MNHLKNIIQHESLIIVLVAVSVFVAMGLRAYIAFRSEAAINVDERYYMSAAATGAAGLGLYPYVLGFDPIPIYPGNGYVIYLYVWAYQIFGPSVLSLRLVSFIASLIALPPIYLTSKKLYGRETALLGLAIFPWLFFFTSSNSVRMDAVTIAYVAWMAFLLFTALEKKGVIWHLAVGVGMGLGLQVHLNTAAVACAFGFLYLIEYLQSAIETGQWIQSRAPLLVYVSGYLIGLAIFVIFTMRPDPASFMEILAKIRLWDNEIAPTSDDQQRTQSLIQTLASPALLLNKEATRYRLLFNDAPLFEFILGLCGVIGLLSRRTVADRRVFVLVVGALLSGAVIFINDSYFYLMHFLPILSLPLAPLLVYGFLRANAQPVRITHAALFVVAVAGSSIIPLTEALGTRDAPPVLPEPGYVAFVRRVSTPEDDIAGPGEYYVQYFADYPRYISLGGVEQVIGLILFEVDNAVDYWKIKAPDFVFAPLFDEEIRTFLETENYVAITPNVWSSPEKWFKPPDFDNPLAIFDDQVAALGASVNRMTIAPCESLTVMTWWQTLTGDVSSDYSVGMYLTDSSGQIVAQNDGPPAGRVWETWSAFEFASDLREIVVPCDLPAGEYHIELALYHYSTLERLPITAEDTTSTENTSQVLTIRVE